MGPSWILPTMRVTYVAPTLFRSMIVSGGFTDDDWKTFPVWAFDISSAEKNGNGVWINLTPSGGLSEETDIQCRTEDDSSPMPDTMNQTVTQQDAWASALPCSPSSRMGHVSVQHGQYLYVFGGILYDRHVGIFYQPQATHVYRLSILNALSNTSSSYQWERITPKIQDIPTHLANACTLRSTPAEQMVRGEFKGGLWQEANKLVVFGGLRLESIKLSETKTLQVDDTLGDVWSYDFDTNSWELMMPAPCHESISLLDKDHSSLLQPLNRTAHAATVLGDQLIVYGGMTNDKSTRPTIWNELDDLWMFDLKARTWSQRSMVPSIPRCYHSIVAWNNTNGQTVASFFGGYRTITDTLTNQPMTYVFDETYLSYPPSSQHLNSPNFWLKASSPLSFETHSMVSNRYEHSAVISQAGWMYVWGGRFQYTSTINGLWALHVAGSNLQLGIAQSFDSSGYDDAVTRFYIVVTALMFLSMGISYIFGRAGGRLMMGTTEDGTGPESGRGGISQELIDTLPIKKFSPTLTERNSSFPRGSSSSMDPRNQGNPEDDTFETESYDDDCCPICLVEYAAGEEIRSLPCGHDFHKTCVDPWLLSSPTCPFCRDSLRDLEYNTSRMNMAPGHDVFQRFRSIFSGSGQESSPTSYSNNAENVVSESRATDGSPSPTEVEPEDGLSEGTRGQERGNGGRQSLEQFIRRMRSLRQSRNIQMNVNSLYSSSLELSVSDTSLPPLNSRSRPFRIPTMIHDDFSERRHRRPRSRNNSGESLSPLNDPLHEPHDFHRTIV
jgi:hypothetical protein